MKKVSFAVTHDSGWSVILVGPAVVLLYSSCDANFVLNVSPAFTLTLLHWKTFIVSKSGFFYIYSKKSLEINQTFSKEDFA